MTKVKLTTCQFTLAGEVMFGARDNQGNYYVATTEVDSCFYPDFTRTKLRLNSLKAALGADVHPEKLRVGRSTRSFIPIASFAALVMHMAIDESNTMARALLQATLAESIQRRMDNALNIIVTPEAYEASVANLYRRLRDEHKMQYIPYLTHWTKVDYPKGCEMNYKVRTNQLKRAAGFDDCVSVDNMSTEQLLQWNAAEIRYDAFRRAGYWHERALKEIATGG